MRSEVKTITSFGNVKLAHDSEKALCAIQDALETMQVPLTHDEAGALALFLSDFPEEFDLHGGAPRIVDKILTAPGWATGTDHISQLSTRGWGLYIRELVLRTLKSEPLDALKHRLQVGLALEQQTVEAARRAKKKSLH